MFYFLAIYFTILQLVIRFTLGDAIQSTPPETFAVNQLLVSYEDVAHLLVSYVGSDIEDDRLKDVPAYYELLENEEKKEWQSGDVAKADAMVKLTTKACTGECPSRRHERWNFAMDDETVTKLGQDYGRAMLEYLYKTTNGKPPSQWTSTFSQCMRLMFVEPMKAWIIEFVIGTDSFKTYEDIIRSSLKDLTKPRDMFFALWGQASYKKDQKCLDFGISGEEDFVVMLQGFMNEAETDIWRGTLNYPPPINYQEVSLKACSESKLFDPTFYDNDEVDVPWVGGPRGKPMKIVKIDANTNKPVLVHQHVTDLNLKPTPPPPEPEQSPILAAPMGAMTLGAAPMAPMEIVQNPQQMLEDDETLPMVTIVSGYPEFHKIEIMKRVDVAITYQNAYTLHTPMLLPFNKCGLLWVTADYKLMDPTFTVSYRPYEDVIEYLPQEITYFPYAMDVGSLSNLLEYYAVKSADIMHHPELKLRSLRADVVMEESCLLVLVPSRHGSLIYIRFAIHPQQVYNLLNVYRFRLQEADRWFVWHYHKPGHPIGCFKVPEVDLADDEKLVNYIEKVALVIIDVQRRFLLKGYSQDLENHLYFNPLLVHEGITDVYELPRKSIKAVSGDMKLCFYSKERYRAGMGPPEAHFPTFEYTDIANSPPGTHEKRIEKLFQLLEQEQQISKKQEEDRLKTLKGLSRKDAEEEARKRAIEEEKGELPNIAEQVWPKERLSHMRKNVSDKKNKKNKKKDDDDDDGGAFALSLLVPLITIMVHW